MIKKFLVLLWFGLPATESLAGPLQRWDFERGFSGWEEPGGESGIVTEPGAPDNHVYRIVAVRAHHTRLILRQSERTSDFVASCRFKVLDWEGEPPVFYLYGRIGKEGFRGVSVSRREVRAFCWRGQKKPGVGIGSRKLSFDAFGGSWVYAKLGCYGGHVFAKVWPAGLPEPGWQISGQSPGQPTGRFAAGVWTSPRTPSRAKVLIDDVTFQPLGEEDLASLRIRVRPRRRLDLAGIPTGRGAFDRRGEVGLATQSTVVVFDRKTGEIDHVVHRSTGRDFVSPETFRPLFRVTLTKPYAGKELETSSADFRSVAVHKPSADTLELRFTDHFSLKLSACVTASACEDGLIRLRLRMTNDEDWAIARIRFPRAAWRAVLGEESADDRLVLPWADGSVLWAPGDRSQYRSAVYPGGAFTQFTAFYDKTAGVYLAAYDCEGHPKQWEMQTVRDGFVEMSLGHLLPEVARREVALDYDVVLGAFVGDWRDAADVYKKWARGQPWCGKTLIEREDVPQFLKEGAGVLITGIASEEGRAKLLGRNLERLPALVAAYRKRTGLAHIIFVPYGWENRGTWAGINYLPAVPSNEAWQKANAALRAQGDRTAFLTSGFWWVVKRQKTRNGPAFDDTADFDRRRAMTIHNADGTVWTVDNYALTRSHGSWRGLSAKLCHGSQAGCDVLRKVFLDVARLGTPLISFDQEIGGGQCAACYNKAHGHLPGHGVWMWTGFRDLCGRILKEGKAIEPELGLFLENTSELAIPYMATYWSRQFGQVDHGATDARGVGLFSYLYHEYVTAIGAACVQGQGARGTRPEPGLRRYVLANNLTRGLIPGPFLHDVPLEAGAGWNATVAEAYFSYCRPYAHFPEYLVLGVTRRPPEVSCADVGLWFYRRDGGGKPLEGSSPPVVKVPLSLPAVTAGSFAAADGSVGTVLVNTTDRPQEATLRLEGASDYAVLYKADRSEVRRWKKPADGLCVTVGLEAYGMRMLVTR